MSAVINTNIAAIRTHNVYSRNNDYMNAAMTKVATGMKINSAKDGASTWAISEKMRERMRANDQANQNVQNDTAMLKTAEGGIGNTIDILKTLKERAINAANDSNRDVDRAVIQQEINQLVAQIDDNASKVSFNGRTLLNGKANTDTSAPAADTSADTWPKTNTTGVTAPTAVSPTSTTTAADHSVFKIAAGNYRWDSSGNSTLAVVSGTKLTELVKSDATAATETLGIQAGDKITLTWKEDGSDTEKTASFTVSGTSTWGDLATSSNWSGDSGLVFQFGTGTAADIKYDATNAVQTTAASPVNLQTGGDKDFYIVGTGTARITSLSVAVTNTSDVLNSTIDPTDTDNTHIIKTTVTRTNAQSAFAPTAHAAAPEATTTGSGGSGGTTTGSGGSGGTTTLPTSLTQSGALKFHIGGEADFSIDMTFGDLTASGLGVNAIDVSTQSGAKSSIEAIDNALNLALKEQTRVGAYENRLGYTSDNLVTMNENLEAADSAMRDADIAKEMTQYMKYAVLSQASQYMLAQAGQNAFQVLNLLQP